MLDKCAPRHFPSDTRENSPPCFSLISIFSTRQIYCSSPHVIAQRKYVPHKLDCILSGFSTSSTTISLQPLPLTSRPLCPASDLTSLQFFWCRGDSARPGASCLVRRDWRQAEPSGAHQFHRQAQGRFLSGASAEISLSSSSRMAKKPALAATSSVTWCHQSMCWWLSAKVPAGQP